MAWTWKVKFMRNWIEHSLLYILFCFTWNMSNLKPIFLQFLRYICLYWRSAEYISNIKTIFVQCWHLNGNIYKIKEVHTTINYFTFQILTNSDQISTKCIANLICLFVLKRPLLKEPLLQIEKNIKNS